MSGLQSTRMSSWRPSTEKSPTAKRHGWGGEFMCRLLAPQTAYLSTMQSSKVPRCGGQDQIRRSGRGLQQPSLQGPGRNTRRRNNKVRRRHKGRPQGPQKMRQGVCRGGRAIGRHPSRLRQAASPHSRRDAHAGRGHRMHWRRHRPEQARAARRERVTGGPAKAGRRSAGRAVVAQGAWHGTRHAKACALPAQVAPRAAKPRLLPGSS